MEAKLDIGKPAPNFTLNDLDGTAYALADYRGRIVILNFWSAECPHTARVDVDLLPLIKQWGDEVQLLSIAANGNEPIEMLRQVAAERGVSPILHDIGCAVADAYGAITTPHIFLLDSEGILRYQGAYDDVAFRQRVATRNYVQEAVAALLNGSKPEITDVLPFGCTVVRC